MHRITPIHRSVMSNRKRSQTWSIKKSSDSHDLQELQKDLFEKSNENNDLQKDLTYTKSHVTMNRNIEKERKMTVQINKVFNSIDDGINNMLDAVLHGIIQTESLHTQLLLIFVISSWLKLERNILRLVESLTIMIRWVKFGTLLLILMMINCLKEVMF